MKQRDMVQILPHKAAQDQAVFETLLQDPQFDDETLGFHAQQAAEKLLKAWLVHQGIDYPKVHRIETLLDILRSSGCELPPALDVLVTLTPFGTTFRYEDLPLNATLDRAGTLDLIVRARDIVVRATAQLKRK